MKLEPRPEKETTVITQKLTGKACRIARPK
jgi:hypothetical protein